MLDEFCTNMRGSGGSRVAGTAGGNRGGKGGAGRQGQQGRQARQGRQGQLRRRGRCRQRMNKQANKQAGRTHGSRQARLQNGSLLACSPGRPPDRCHGPCAPVALAGSGNRWQPCTAPQGLYVHSSAGVAPAESRQQPCTAQHLRQTQPHTSAGLRTHIRQGGGSISSIGCPQAKKHCIL